MLLSRYGCGPRIRRPRAAKTRRHRPHLGWKTLRAALEPIGEHHRAHHVQGRPTSAPVPDLVGRAVVETASDDYKSSALTVVLPAYGRAEKGISPSTDAERRCGLKPLRACPGRCRSTRRRDFWLPTGRSSPGTALPAPRVSARRPLRRIYRARAH